MNDIQWSIDSLVIRGNTIFGHGWVFHATCDIAKIFVYRVVGDSRTPTSKIPVEIGKFRGDVASVFNEYPRAENSGFLVYGELTRSIDKCANILFECHLADGEILVKTIPASVIVFLDETSASTIYMGLSGSSKTLLRRGFYYLRKGEFSLLFDKVRTHFFGRPKKLTNSIENVIQLLRVNERKQVTWWVDHDLGGGANLYRRNQVEGLIAEDRTVIVLSFHVRTLSPILHIQNRRVKLSLSIPDLNFAFEIARNLIIDQIIYNTAVSFPGSERIPKFLLNLQSSSQARLLMLIHDFFIICPSHFLLDDTGKYCDIPDVHRCATCLPQNQYGFVTLFAGGEIEKWRLAWSEVLNAADEIRVFSRSSGALIRKAYPSVFVNKLNVLPHEVKYFVPEKIKISPDSRLRIGVIGNIGYHKGSGVIRGLVRAIKESHANAEICVIGTLEGQFDSEIVCQTGRYSHDQLSHLIRKTKVNVMLFPSIWPETFSYVVQEMMEMELPIAAFNFGAPSERLAEYSCGLILDNDSPDLVLRALQRFHQVLYFS